MPDKNYSVVGPMAIVNLDNGSAVHLQRGAGVPSNVVPSHLQHLIDQGLVGEVEVVGGLEPILSGDLTKQVTFSSQAEAKDEAKAEKEAEKAAARPASRTRSES